MLSPTKERKPRFPAGLLESPRFPKPNNGINPAEPGVPRESPGRVLTGLEKAWVRWRLRWHIFSLARRNLGSWTKALQACRRMIELGKKVYGSGGNLKFVRAGGKNYFNLYSPGFPSPAFDRYMEGELNRLFPFSRKTDELNFIFLAVTCKCPLRCEHCFEWDNLKKKETFTLAELKELMGIYLQKGFAQLHITGGEPLVRLEDLLELIRSGPRDIEYWVLSSGFNLTAENARRLKQAGATGVVISLDHYEAGRHDAFRDFPGAYSLAMAGLQHARQAGLLTAQTLCVTREFLAQPGSLLAYASLARKNGVGFIQLLEPRAVGHYQGQAVSLDRGQLEQVEEFYQQMNFDPAFQSYPAVIYHGYHQRRLGCLSAGNRNLYIDSAGWAHSCPFCHSRDYHTRELLDKPGMPIPAITPCPLFGGERKDR